MCNKTDSEERHAFAFDDNITYARKVGVVAHETGLISQIERLATNPHADEYLRTDNPLCRVPTLILDDRSALFDLPDICEYLDSLYSGAKLFPAAGEGRWAALRLQALGDGMLDASLSRRMETNRPASEQSPMWIARQIMAINAARRARSASGVVISSAMLIEIS
jgi:glutathione S-transferase